MKNLALLLTLAAGCAHAPRAEEAPLTSLYDRLGGKDAIGAVVDAFMSKVAADKRINRYFWNADATTLREALLTQICSASGGPCVYTGRDMKTAHAGMNIKGPEFGALVEDLVGALDQYKVPPREKNELLSMLAPMKGDIVGH
jgi:hemoglobin